MKKKRGKGGEQKKRRKEKKGHLELFGAVELGLPSGPQILNARRSIEIQSMNIY